jgi:hypothetical protein
VSFRRPKSEAREAIRWRDFLLDQRELFEESGLPGLMVERRIFDEFLMEGFVEMPGGLADGVAFDVDELDEQQRVALGSLVALYVARFGDPGLTGAIALLEPK